MRIRSLQLFLTFTLMACGHQSAKTTSINDTSKTSQVVTPTQSPTLSAPPIQMTDKERMERVKELMGDKPVSPEEIAEAKALTSVVANGKSEYRSMAAKALKMFSKMDADAPTAEQTNVAQQTCKDLIAAESGVLTEPLKKVLHDPSSLQDFQIEKCVPIGGKTIGVNVRAGFRAKNTFGALVINQEHFIVLPDSSGKSKYKAIVSPD